MRLMIDLFFFFAGPLIDDTWFLVIISSCVGVTLLGILLAIAFLKYRE